MDNQLGTSSRMQPPPIYPHNWREIVNGSLEEGFVLIALGTLKELIKPEFVPSIDHIQLLIYLSIYPVKHSIPSELPLEILSKLLSLHRPVSFSQAIPFHPSSSNSREEDPIWLQWDYKRSDLHKSIWRCMRKCLDEGIWALIWEKNENTKINGKRKRGQDGNVYEEDEENTNNRKISKEGWRLLDWLIDFWRKDGLDEDRENDIVYSPLFLKQLPKPFDRTGQLPRNDASYALSILRSAYLTPESDEEGERRKSTAVNLLSLVIDTTIGSKPPFLPSALSSSITHLAQSLSCTTILDIVRRLERSSHWKTACHILALIIEDMAGMRDRKLEQRRVGIRDKNQINDNHFESDLGLDRPTSKYLFEEVLPLCVVGRNNNAENGTKMILLKLELMRITRTHPYEGDDSEEVRRSFRNNSDWWGNLETSWNIIERQEEVPSSVKALGEAFKICVKSLL